MTANKIYGILFTIFGNKITIEWIVSDNMKKKTYLEPLTKISILRNSSIFAIQLELCRAKFAVLFSIIILINLSGIRKGGDRKMKK